MKRKAIIVGCVKTSGQKTLPGVERDEFVYRKYLNSVMGGAWDDNEIEVKRDLRSSDWAQLRASLDQQKLDYFLLTFSGHGHHPAGITNVVMADGTDVPYTNLFLSASACRRQQLILDCCREIPAEAPVQLHEELAKSFVKAAAAGPDRAAAQALFSNALSASGTGNEVIYSCGLNETAADESDAYKAGGLFTMAMIHSAMIYFEKLPKQSALSIDKVFEIAKKITIDESQEQQTPTMKSIRRTQFFPFVVKP